MDKKRPRVGLGIFVMDSQKRLLLSKRTSSEGGGQGYWQLPGGAIEWGERWQTGAHRELLEETGLRCGNIEYVAVMDDIRPEDDKHYIIIFCRATGGLLGEVDHREPEKNTPWKWFTSDNLPSPIFPPLDALLHKLRNISWW